FAAVVVVVGAGIGTGVWLGRQRLFAPQGPELAAVSPGRASVGDTVALRGKGFALQPEGNVVTIGGRSARVLSARPDELKVAVPVIEGQEGDARVAVRVEVEQHSSGVLSLDIVAKDALPVADVTAVAAPLATPSPAIAAPSPVKAAAATSPAPSSSAAPRVAPSPVAQAAVTPELPAAAAPPADRPRPTPRPKTAATPKPEPSAQPS